MSHAEAIAVARAQLQVALRSIENAERALHGCDRTHFKAVLVSIEGAGDRITDAQTDLEGMAKDEAEE